MPRAKNHHCAKQDPFEMRLQTRIFFVFFTVMTIFVAYTYMRLTKEVNEQFVLYDAISRERSITDIVNHLEAIYRQEKSWSLNSGQDIVRYAMRNGQVISLLNVNRDVIWKMDKWAVAFGSTWIQSNQTPPARRNIGRAIRGDFDEEIDLIDRLEYQEVERPLIYDGRTVGYVIIGDYTQNNLNPEGREVRQQLLLSVTGTAFLGLVMSVISAMVLARVLSDPLKNLTHAAVAMQSGVWVHNLQDKSGTVEIGQLTRALNYLASSLDDQRALRKRLTSDISHELRTPLNALLALSEAYMDGVVKVTPENLQTFRGEILRLASLVTELSKISDLEDDQLVLEYQVFNLEDALRELATVYEQLSMRSGLSFKASLNANLSLNADLDRFKQAIINLLSNAIKYTPAQGTVELKAFQRADGVIIEIRDSGYGIPDEEKEHIFERFYRLEQSRNRGTGGVGLGLTLVKRIADAHQWQVSVKNNHPKGSIFSIKINT